MEDIAEEHWLRDNTMSDNDREAYVKGILACAESMYSEKYMLSFADFVYKIRFESEDIFWKATKDLLDEFKKK